MNKRDHAAVLDATPVVLGLVVVVGFAAWVWELTRQLDYTDPLMQPGMLLASFLLGGCSFWIALKARQKVLARLATWTGLFGAAGVIIAPLIR